MKKFDQKKVLILFGPPGAGKGTQGQLLAEFFGLYYLETSHILERKFSEGKKNEIILIEGQKYSLRKEKENWQSGKLCSPPFVTYLIAKKIQELFKQKRGILLSGSPRTLYEAEMIMPLLEKLYGKKNIKIFFLEISPKETIFRNSHRRICELMRHPIVYLKENKNLKYCPLDGSKLLKRKGLDDPETIKKRLREYKERTLPLIEYFKKRKFKIFKVNGSPPPAVVFKNILKILK